MGKRKSSKPPPKKKRPTLDSTFNCPFCNSSKSVSAQLDQDRGVGTVTCSVCGANYTSKINSLSEAIDVYSDWLDKCEEENADLGGDVRAPSPPPPTRRRVQEDDVSD